MATITIRHTRPITTTVTHIHTSTHTIEPMWCRDIMAGTGSIRPVTIIAMTGVGIAGMRDRVDTIGPVQTAGGIEQFTPSEKLDLCLRPAKSAFCLR